MCSVETATVERNVMIVFDDGNYALWGKIYMLQYATIIHHLGKRSVVLKSK